MPVDDRELTLIANGWAQVERGRWTHERYTNGARTRKLTLERAIEEDRKLLPPSAPDNVAPNPIHVAWCGVENDPED